MSKTGQPEAAEPRRLRWSVPAADVSVNQWLDVQESISSSLRLLIRESIEREGYIDVVNKPVEQLPRRGRPPQAETAEAGQSSTPQTQYVDSPKPVTYDGASSTDAEPSSPIEAPVDGATPEPTVMPAGHDAEPEPASTPVRTQASIDEIMSATRR
jgi:hypothetical protein